MPRRERRGDQARVPGARARAASGRVGRAGRRGSLPRGRRGVRGALQLGDAASSTTASATPACAAAASRPARSTSAASPISSRRSSATTSSAAAGAEAARAAPTSPPRSRSSSSRWRRGDEARGAVRASPFPASAAAATERSPTRARSTCPTCGGSGRVQQVSRSVFGEFVRTGTLPARAAASGQLVETPCSDCNGAGRMIEERTAEVEIPAGIHDGQRIRIGGEGHAGALGGRAGDVYVEVHVRPDDRFVREGDDIYSTVDLHDRRRPRSARPSRSRRSRARRELDVRPGHAAGRGARLARTRDAGPAGLRARRPPRARQRRASRARSPTSSARLLEEFDAPVDGRDLQAGRGVLRQAEERVPLNAAARLGGVPLERAEEARAEWLERFPGGLRGGRASRRRARARRVQREDVPPLGAPRSRTSSRRLGDRWREFHQPVRVGPLWIGPPWHEPPDDAIADRDRSRVAPSEPARIRRRSCAWS